MGTPRLTREQVLEAVDLVNQHGKINAAADAIGISRGAMSNRYHARNRPEFSNADPAIVDAAKAGNVEDIRNLSHFWKIAKDDEGNGYSLFIKNPASGEELSLQDMVQDALATAPTPPKYEKRKLKPSGDNLLIVDLADVHINKLSVKTETGYEYNSEVATHRMIEGTKGLLSKVSPFGVGRILFVTGNDILNTDNSKSTTTSGTPQDTYTTVFQAFRDAKVAYQATIEQCAKVADVDLMHNMSNHDWISGWMLAQTLGAQFANHPNVNFSDYAASERHRKFYRFNNSLFGLTHADGAKEEKLLGLMMEEAREHISGCQHLYWILHHLHHGISRIRGSGKPILKEKDHTGMTAISFGSGIPEGQHMRIEHVRSPSPPESWHDRNGFVNRQGVECFLVHPLDGIFAKFTEWF